MYEIAQTTFSPELYLRSDNWDGTTYAASEDFCADKGGNLCPYRAVCVLGPDSEPISGYRGDVDAWIPISDSANEWVQISSNNACVKYSSTSQSGPEWGISGSKELTENLLCCFGFGVAPTELSTVIDSQVDVPAMPPQGSHYTDEELAAYIATENKYDPNWYNRLKGWTGTTYSEAVEFCSKLHEGFELCPQEAICPLGEDSEPLGGFRVGPKGSWVPISVRVPKTTFFLHSQREFTLFFAGRLKLLDPSQYQWAIRIMHSIRPRERKKSCVGVIRRGR